MNETRRAWISYTKSSDDVSGLDELLVIKPENFLCYSEYYFLNDMRKLFYAAYLTMNTQTHSALSFRHRLDCNNIHRHYNFNYIYLDIDSVVAIWLYNTSYHNPLYL